MLASTVRFDYVVVKRPVKVFECKQSALVFATCTLHEVVSCLDSVATS